MKETEKGLLYYFQLQTKNLDTSKEFEQQITPIEMPIMIDYIEFKEWNNHLLSIHAIEFLTQQPVHLIFNAQTNEITQKNGLDPYLVRFHIFIFSSAYLIFASASSHTSLGLLDASAFAHHFRLSGIGSYLR